MVESCVVMNKNKDCPNWLLLTLWWGLRSRSENAAKYRLRI